MEPYRSTLATTALAVLGIVAVAHILHPGNFEHPTRPARPIVTAVEQAGPPVAWVDLPAERLEAARPESSADMAALLVPQLTAGVPPDATMAPPLASAITASAPQARGGDAARRRAAQRAVRARQAERARARTAAAAVPAQVQRQDAREAKTDPLGDLLRGLGLGRDS